jgi:hypothetical protein
MSTTTTVRVRSYQQQFSPVDTQAQHQIYEVQEAVQDGEMKHQPRRQSQSQAHPGVVASTPRFSMPPAPFQQPYPMYSGLQQAPMVRPKAFRDSAPIPLNVPRRLSSSSSPISQIVMDSNQAAQGVVAMSPRTSWSPPITSPMHYRFRRAVPRRSNETFAALPVEVLELILEKLKQLHLGAGSTSCTTCWMRDLCNVCLSSRKWAQSARAALYGDVQLVGPDSAAHRKKFKLTQGARMLVLRRTLRSKPELAALVRRLKVPLYDVPENGPASKGALSMEHYEDLTASLVMACPNLEQLTGPTPTYRHAFTKLFHALSTRSNLKAMDWLVEPLPTPTPAAAETSQRSRHSTLPSPNPHNKGAYPSGLDPFQADMFLDMHTRWTNLESLTIHCLPGGTLAPSGLLTKVLARLPSLKHLHLCNIPSNAFNDSNLLALPRLLSLSLSHVGGITSSGFSAFATRANSQSLQRFHLRHTPLSSLPALARLLSNLTQLRAFSLIQAYPPVMPESDTFSLWMMPYLASSSVVHLHWDITSTAPEGAHPCDAILAKSIAAGGFPHLRKLRAPNDPAGVFQNLCRPVERVDMASDRFRRPTGNGPIQLSNSNSKSDYRKTLTPASARPPPCTDLCSARLAAQARLEAAREVPRFRIDVTTEDGATAAEFHMGGHMGTVGSQIEYLLHPDHGSSDEKGGLVDVRDLTEDHGETLNGTKEGCTGRWNAGHGIVADKKEKEPWWHTERGRWRGVRLQ